MRRIAVRAIVTDGNKILLAKLKSENGVQSFYSTIGGGLNDDEGLVDGIKREVIEETGIVAQVGKLLCIQQFTDNHYNIEFFFHVTNTDDFKNIDLSKTTHGLKEIAEIGFFDPKEITVLPDFLSKSPIQEIINSEEIILFNYL